MRLRLVLTVCMQLGVKRIYDDASPDDGYRVLVDRLWPRGVSKERAALDVWAKDAAPSAELRKAWHSAPDEAWEAFADDYRAELVGSAAVDSLRAEVQQHPIVTLLTATQNLERTHALVLREALER